MKYTDYYTAEGIFMDPIMFTGWERFRPWINDFFCNSTEICLPNISTARRK